MSQTTIQPPTPAPYPSSGDAAVNRSATLNALAGEILDDPVVEKQAQDALAPLLAQYGHSPLFSLGVGVLTDLVGQWGLADKVPSWTIDGAAVLLAAGAGYLWQMVAKELAKGKAAAIATGSDLT